MTVSLVVRGSGVSAQGLPSNSVAQAAHGPERSAPAHGMSADERGRVSASARDLPLRSPLDAGDVGVGVREQPPLLLLQHGGDLSGRHSENGQVDGPRAGGGRARASGFGDAGRGRVRVLEVDVHTAGSESQADGRADQTGADDGCGTYHRLSPDWLTRSRRRAAAPPR